MIILKDLIIEQLDICKMVRAGQEQDYDFVDSLGCPLTAITVDNLIVIAVFLAKFKCGNCTHYNFCKLRKQFNL